MAVRTNSRRHGYRSKFVLLCMLLVAFLPANNVRTAFSALAKSSADAGKDIRLGKMLESKLPNNNVQVSSSDGFAHAVTQNKGMQKGEDVIVTAGGNGKYKVSLLMDGHGGQEVALYVGQVLQKALLNECASVSREDFAACVQTVFEGIQADIRSKQLSGGCTAIAIFLDAEKQEVSFACAGDSSALIVREGRVLFRTRKHGLGDSRQGTLTEEEARERFRIESHEPKYDYFIQDGYLCNPRGMCVMPTRGLGDIHMEAAGFISKPWVSEFRGLAAGDIVIIASDGIWDVLPEESVAAWVGKQDRNADMVELARALAEGAVSQWIRVYGRASEADDISISMYRA